MRRTRGALSSSVAGALAGLLAAGPAHAQPVQPTMALLVVPAGGATDEAAARTRVKAREVIARSGRFRFLVSDEILDPAGARARAARVAEGLSAAGAAREAYGALDTGRALAEANRAIAAFADADLTVHMGDLVGAWTVKIASLVADGENKAAQAEIDQLLGVEPSAQFSKDLFPPEILAHAERSRSSRAGAGAVLEIRTDPPGAEVYVDGHFRGISPASAQDLAPGDHYVTVKRPGYVLAQQTARPGAAEIALRKADGFSRYQAAVDRISRDPEGRQRDEAARNYGIAAGVDQVLVLIAEVQGPRQGRLIGLRIDTRDGHNLAFRVEAADAERMDAGAEAFASALLGSDDARRGGPVTHYGGPGRTMRKPAGYPLQGHGAAAAVAGTILGASALGTNRAYRDMAPDDPDRDAFRSRGRGQALAADLSFLVALLSGGAGGYLAFWPSANASDR